MALFSSKKSWHYILLIILLLITVGGIFDHGLWAPEEPRVAEIGREMLDPAHSWAIPMLNNQPFIEKPPLVYWAIAVCLKVFGIYDWAARIPNMLFTLGILLFTYLLGKRLYGSKGVGLGSALVLMTSIGFLGVSHRISCDIGLIFFIVGAVYFLWRAFNGSPWWYAPFYIFACGAFFSKGFIAFAFLGLFFLTWVIWTRNWHEIWRARPWLGILLVSIPIAFWFRELVNYPQSNLLYTFVVENHLHRFLPVGGGYYAVAQGEPFYFYLTEGLPAQFAPWIIILLLAIPYIWFTLSSANVSNRQAGATKFLVSWFVPGFLLLSLAGSKFGTYLFPLIPPLAILVAGWFYAKNKEKWLNILGLALGVVMIAGWSIALFVYKIDEKMSMKPFCEELSAKISPDTRFYGFVGDYEGVRGVVPFYTGRYFTLLYQESELASLAKRSDIEMAVITYDDGCELVGKYFPYVWLDCSEQYGRHMCVFANMRK